MKAPGLVEKMMSNVCSLKREEENVLRQIAQTHLLLITDLAGELLAGAAQSNEIARFTYTLQKDLY